MEKKQRRNRKNPGQGKVMVFNVFFSFLRTGIDLLAFVVHSVGELIC